MGGPTAGLMAIGGTVTGAADGGTAIDASTGNPAPSLRMNGGGVWARRIRVVAGARRIRVDAMQTQSIRARPTMTILKNTAVGVSTDLTYTADAGSGWVTITSAELTITATGALWVILRNPEPRLCDSCYFDNLFAQ